MSRALRCSGMLAAIALCATLAGCSTLAYYSQAIHGQWNILRRAEPVQQAIANAAIPEVTRAHLQASIGIRDFASRELGLPDNQSYRRYADLGRPYAVWNVVAAPEFSVQPIESCFPVAGCVAYRGYFDEADALRYAEALNEKGDDVFVYGVPAYSTLGWFSDPLLNTFIDEPIAEVARLVFHELAHQLVYVKGDSAFNESFAVAVEAEGISRWTAARSAPRDAAVYETLRARGSEFADLALRYKQQLDTIYHADIDADTMRQAKRAVFSELRREYAALRASWGGWRGYDAWFGEAPNNAHLASIATYTQWLPGFQVLLKESNGDLSLFYDRVRALAQQERPARDEALARLAAKARSARVP